MQQSRDTRTQAPAETQLLRVITRLASLIAQPMLSLSNQDSGASDYVCRRVHEGPHWGTAFHITATNS